MIKQVNAVAGVRQFEARLPSILPLPAYTIQHPVLMIWQDQEAKPNAATADFVQQNRSALQGCYNASMEAAGGFTLSGMAKPSGRFLATTPTARIVR